jgi:hypothetical protein
MGAESKACGEFRALPELLSFTYNTTMTEDLNEIVDRAYGLFGGYAVAKPLDVCTQCCITLEEEAQLVSLNVRSIPLKLLYKWNHAAKTKAPDLKEFKHFLPRFLELIAQFEFPAHSVELALKSFGYYRHGDWTKQEWQLIEDFSGIYFRRFLRMFPIPTVRSLDEIILMLFPTGISAQLFLDEWRQTTSSKAAAHFAIMSLYATNSLENKTYLNAFANQGFVEMMTFWLNDREVVSGFSERIANIVLNDNSIDEFTRSELSRAYEICVCQ